MPSNSNSNSTDTTSPPQLNLFPLRPSSVADDDNVEYLFNSAADGSATSLTSIFGAVPTSSTSSSMTSEDNNNDKDNNDLLARTALRKKERDRSREEKWVCYSEVMSSGAAATWPLASEGGDGDGGGDEKMMMMKKRRRRRLELKLDYQEIMNSWGRSLIHIQMESPATVPEIMNLDHHNHQMQSTVMIPPDHPGGWGFSNDGGLWRVPEAEKKWNTNNKNGENMKIKEEGIEGGQHLREASMLRYKEKRQSRLFSKRIRYQVRKINAEKRPRLKGRFVKKS